MLLNRLRVRIGNEIIPEIGRAVTVSFGVTAYAKPDSPEDLVKRVDQALYRSKQAGRDKVTKIARPRKRTLSKQKPLLGEAR